MLIQASTIVIDLHADMRQINIRSAVCMRRVPARTPSVGHSCQWITIVLLAEYRHIAYLCDKVDAGERPLLPRSGRSNSVEDWLQTRLKADGPGSHTGAGTASSYSALASSYAQ